MSWFKSEDTPLNKVLPFEIPTLGKCSPNQHGPTTAQSVLYSFVTLVFSSPKGLEERFQEYMQLTVHTTLTSSFVTLSAILTLAAAATFTISSNLVNADTMVEEETDNKTSGIVAVSLLFLALVLQLFASLSLTRRIPVRCRTFLSVCVFLWCSLVPGQSSQKWLAGITASIVLRVPVKQLGVVSVAVVGACVWTVAVEKTFESAVWAVSSLAILLSGTYIAEKTLRMRFVALTELTDHFTSLSLLIKRSFPASIKDKLIDCCYHDRKPIYDRYEGVSVLCLEIMGWDAWAEINSSSAMVPQIHEIYSAFDDLVRYHGAVKLPSEKNRYIAVAGVTGIRRGTLLDLVDLSLDMRRVISGFHWPNSDPISTQIGISHGPAIAGLGFINGVPKLHVFGSCVSEALSTRIGANAEIFVKESVADRLRPFFDMTRAGQVRVADQGQVLSQVLWCINGRRRGAIVGHAAGEGWVLSKPASSGLSSSGLSHRHPMQSNASSSPPTIGSSSNDDASHTDTPSHTQRSLQIADSISARVRRSGRGGVRGCFSSLRFRAGALVGALMTAATKSLQQRTAVHMPPLRMVMAQSAVEQLNALSSNLGGAIVFDKQIIERLTQIGAKHALVAHQATNLQLLAWVVPLPWYFQYLVYAFALFPDSSAALVRAAVLFGMLFVTLGLAVRELRKKAHLVVVLRLIAFYFLYLLFENGMFTLAHPHSLLEEEVSVLYQYLFTVGMMPIVMAIVSQGSIRYTAIILFSIPLSLLFTVAAFRSNDIVMPDTKYSTTGVLMWNLCTAIMSIKLCMTRAQDDSYLFLLQAAVVMQRPWAYFFLSGQMPSQEWSRSVMYNQGTLVSSDHRLVGILTASFRSRPPPSQTAQPLPEELLSVQTQLQSEFAKLCAKYGAIPLPTIGDTLQCATGMMQTPSEHHCADLTRLALELDSQPPILFADGTTMHVHIGLHIAYNVVVAAVGKLVQSVEVFGKETKVAHMLTQHEENGRVLASRPFADALVGPDSGRAGGQARVDFAISEGPARPSGESGEGHFGVGVVWIESASRNAQGVSAARLNSDSNIAASRMSSTSSHGNGNSSPAVPSSTPSARLLYNEMLPSSQREPASVMTPSRTSPRSALLIQGSPIGRVGHEVSSGRGGGADDGNSLIINGSPTKHGGHPHSGVHDGPSHGNGLANGLANGRLHISRGTSNHNVNGNVDSAKGHGRAAGIGKDDGAAGHGGDGGPAPAVTAREVSSGIVFRSGAAPLLRPPMVTIPPSAHGSYWNQPVSPSPIHHDSGETERVADVPGMVLTSDERRVSLLGRARSQRELQGPSATAPQSPANFSITSVGQFSSSVPGTNASAFNADDDGLVNLMVHEQSVRKPH